MVISVVKKRQLWVVISVVNVSVAHQNILCNRSKTHNTKFGVMGDTYPAVGVTSD